MAYGPYHLDGEERLAMHSFCSCFFIYFCIQNFLRKIQNLFMGQKICAACLIILDNNRSAHY